MLGNAITTHADYVWEVNEQKEIVWEWWSMDHVEDFPSWDLESEDPVHPNSIQVLPPNRWFEAGDERFRPGNILVSGRNLDTIFIVDRRTGDVVWQFSKNLDYQHEASMIEKGRLGEGLILVFNNGTIGTNGYRRTLVQAIDPTRGEVEWNTVPSTSSHPSPAPSRRCPATISPSPPATARIFEITLRERSSGSGCRHICRCARSGCLRTSVRN